MRMLPTRRRVLWKLRRAGQIVRCEICPHPFGTELRYLVNGKQLMSRVFEEWDPLERVARAWHEGLKLRGWQSAAFGAGTHLSAVS